MENEKLYNLSIIKDIAQGDESFVKSLLQIFIDTVPTNCTELVEALSKGNLQEASELAHKLKSSVDTLQIVTIADDIRSIESNSKAEKNQALMQQLAIKIKNTINEVIAQFRINNEL